MEHGRKRERYGARSNRHADLRNKVKTHDEKELYRYLESIDTPFLLALDCVQDPHNFGACLRTADAAGVHAVICPKRRSAPVSETVRKIACGGAERMFIAQVTNLARTLRQLQDDGVRVVGTSDSASTDIHGTDLTGPLALVLGAEATGIRRLTTELCDDVVVIPMARDGACLNVSVATGVCLFEAVRQRSMNAG